MARSPGHAICTGTALKLAGLRPRFGRVTHVVVVSFRRRHTQCGCGIIERLLCACMSAACAAATGGVPASGMCRCASGSHRQFEYRRGRSLTVRDGESSCRSRTPGTTSTDHRALLCSAVASWRAWQYLLLLCTSWSRTQVPGDPLLVCAVHSQGCFHQRVLPRSGTDPSPGVMARSQLAQ